MVNSELVLKIVSEGRYNGSNLKNMGASKLCRKGVSGIKVSPKTKIPGDS
jgi:hypothetical protein